MSLLYLKKAINQSSLPNKILPFSIIRAESKALSLLQS